MYEIARKPREQFSDIFVYIVRISFHMARTYWNFQTIKMILTRIFTHWKNLISNRILFSKILCLPLSFAMVNQDLVVSVEKKLSGVMCIRKSPYMSITSSLNSWPSKLALNLIYQRSRNEIRLVLSLGFNLKPVPNYAPH